MLPEIDDSLPEEAFNSIVFEALKAQGGFILNLNDGLSSAINDLFAAYDEFREQTDCEKSQYAGDSKELKGYFFDGIVDGNKAGPRFFIKRDADDKIRHVLPPAKKTKISMQEAEEALSKYVRKITAKTLAALEYGFNLKNKEFFSHFDGYTIRTSVHHYLPVTQEKLKSWITLKNLTKTEDGRIEAFSAHKDLVPLSILIYRKNEPCGLELAISGFDKQDYQPVVFQNSTVENLKAIVILGRCMESLTDHLLNGVSHRVIAKPLVKSGDTFSRDGINIFIFLNPKKLVEPIVISANGPHYTPQSIDDFYTSWSMVYSKEAEKRSYSSLTDEELNIFPREVEIKCLHNRQGIVYKRV